MTSTPFQIQVSCRLISEDEFWLDTSALAMATRCCSPPDKRPGKLSFCVQDRPRVESALLYP